MKTSFNLLAKALTISSALLGLASLSLQADTVYVTTYGSGGVASNALTPCQPDLGFASVCNNPFGAAGVTISTYGSTATANPPGAPTRSKCTYGFTNAANAGPINWTVQPPPLAGAGAVYTIEICHSANGATNVLVTAFSTDGTVSDSCTNSPVFDLAHNSGANLNTWKLMGFITNNPGVTQPKITFYMASGYVDNLTTPGPAQRLYIDCFKFTSVDPCLGAAPTVSVPGPLLAGANSVNVSGVVSGATEVDVFVDTTQIGQLTSGITAGTVTVPISPALVAGQSISARQIKGACTGDVSSVTFVGSGPNPTLQVALQAGKVADLTGPIGANAGSQGSPLYWIHANGRRSQGFATGPTGGYVITPSTNWVTLTFNSDSDEVYDWNGNVFPYTNTDNYAVFQGLALAIDDVTPDIGPYQIYIDSIYNGTNLIQGFEGPANYTYGVMFLRPSASGTTSKYIYSAPDTNYVNNAAGVNADTGTNSLFVTWSFKSTDVNSWVNLYTGGTGTQYPQIDLHQPVTVRMLVLPVGTSVGRNFDGDVSFITNSGTAFWIGGSNTLGITVTGSGNYTYQWALNHTDIAGATTASYTLQPISGLTAADSGLYTVTVTDQGAGAIVRSLNVQVQDPVPSITNQPAHVIVAQGSPLSLTVGADGHVPGGYPLSYQWRTNGVEDVSQTTATFSVASASLANVGSYDVYVWNTYGYVTSIVATVDVVASGVVPGTGTGLRGDYWTTHYSTNAFGGAPTVTRVDPVIDFNFGTGSPAAGISVDYFTARWLGQVQALGTDTYTFSTISDDGVRLWVNNQLLVDNWTLHAPTTNSASVALTGTDKYDIQLEYFENGGSAVAQLYWASASGSIGWEPVPQSQLYPAASLPTPTVTFSVNQGTNLVLNWGPGNYTLVWSTDVAGPYNNKILGAVSPYTIIIGSEPQRFFKVQVQ